MPLLYLITSIMLSTMRAKKIMKPYVLSLCADRSESHSICKSMLPNDPGTGQGNAAQPNVT